jgi:hypothetical protein
MGFLEEKINDAKKIKIVGNFHYNDLIVMSAFSYLKENFVDKLKLNPEGIESKPQKMNLFEKFDNEIEQIHSGLHPKILVEYLEVKNILKNDYKSNVEKILKLFEQDQYLIEDQNWDGFALSEDVASFGFSDKEKPFEIARNFQKFKSLKTDSELFFEFNKFYRKNQNHYFLE